MEGCATLGLEKGLDVFELLSGIVYAVIDIIDKFGLLEAELDLEGFYVDLEALVFVLFLHECVWWRGFGVVAEDPLLSHVSFLAKFGGDFFRAVYVADFIWN